ncbi:uncharacterized protein BKCO1_8000197 [Diplodia corticola]|uniref:F-box domain-containing protein n=1 Tax=Diplodia corticola TaxID=236234 RepID=A0A1J9R629_9PEZI|nr:uncharacterized protein BKCO1_8000197 [Diplodia corticola]OJD36974.1 hypothetical protein BKCO1_8000197 [Diplodia corticola]
MSEDTACTLGSVIKMPITDQQPENEQPLTVLHKSYLSKLLHSSTDPVAGPSDPNEPCTKTPMFVGDKIRESLDVEDLLNLRLVNKAVKSWVEGQDFDFSAKAFTTLHLNRRLYNRLDEQLSLKALQNIARFCSHFVIDLEDMLNPVSPLVYAGVPVFDTENKSIWMQLFTILGSICTLKISAPGQPDWHRFGSGEALLESIRVALEVTLPAGLRDITLSPINATGLLHFRWRGAAFKETTWMAEAFWSRLRTLHIDLHNPLPYYSKSNQKDFTKALHDYLGSFSHSLEILRFSWIGTVGPNPLLLDLRYGGHNFSSPAIKWSTLTTLHLQNILAHSEDPDVLMSARCPNLHTLKLEDIQMLEKFETIHLEEDNKSDDNLEHVISRDGSPVLFSISSE